MGSISISVYGNPAGDYVGATTGGSNIASYSIADVGASTLITKAKWTELLTNVNKERNRRGLSSITVALDNPIASAKLNALKDGIQPFYSAGFSGVSANTIVLASHINSMIDKIQEAGAVCLCNCNYCTCNCNYCTCNCNYCTCNCNYCTCNCNHSCTCNCNYSDIRLKENIKFLYKRRGLKIYEWSYIDSEKVYEGVIAQDLIGTKFSKALIVDKNGYFMVDYSLLPINLKVIK